MSESTRNNEVCEVLGRPLRGRRQRSRFNAAICAVCAGAIAAATAMRVDAAQDESNAIVPAAADVRAAFDVGARWVTQFGDLPRLKELGAHVVIGGAHGVCVVLRNGGRVVGVGADWTGDDLMLRRAIGRALGDVLGDDAARGDNLIPPDIDDLGGADDGNEQDDRAAIRELIRTGLGERLTMELEVSGPLQPLLGRTFDQLAQRLEPGLDGVAIRAGARMRFRFPAQMRANNTAGSIARIASALAYQLNLPRVGYDQLVRDHDVSAYRFRTRTLIQDAPGGKPVERVRGDDLVELESITLDRLRAAAHGVAGHILASRFPGSEPLGMMGSYRPVSDEHDPFLAPPLEQALCAWALADYARMSKDVVAQVGSMELLQELAAHDTVEPDPLASVVDCAAIVLACIAAPEALEHGAVRGMYELAREKLILNEDVDGVFVAPDDTGQALRPVSAQAHAVMTYASAMLLRSGEERMNAPRVRAALEAAWASGQVVSMTPWLGWAEIAYAEATGEPIAHVDDLTRLRDLLHENRFGTGQRAIPADAAGGFRLSQGPGTWATAQTARPAALLATMLRIEVLTPPDGSAKAIADHRETLRFLVQLTVREGLAGSFRNAPRALGGVRAAPWDTDQPLAAQAMALAALTESVRTLEELGFSGW